MSACPHCGHEHAAHTVTCPNCGRLLLPANQLNLVISLSVVSVAILTALLYWGLSELVWLPAAQTGLGFAIDAFNLQNHVPYWTGLIERRGFFSANWLLLGALFYIPVITIVAMRLGLRRVLVAAIASPAPFAVMDVWSWWVRAVAIPANVDRASVLLPLPGLLQFLAVFAISAIVATPFYFLFVNIGRFLPKRVVRGFLIQPVGATTALALPRPVTPALPPKPLELPDLSTPPETIEVPQTKTPVVEAVPVTNIVPEPAAAIVEVPPVVSVQPEPEPPAPVVEVQAKPAVTVAEPIPTPALQPEPIAEKAEFEAAASTESVPRSSFPIWIAIVGLVAIAIIGTLLIIFALRA